MQSIGVVWIEFDGPAQMALRRIVFAPNKADLTKQPMAAALLRVEIDRLRGHSKRPVYHRWARGGVTIDRHAHPRQVRLCQRVLRVKGDCPLQHGGGLLITVVRMAPVMRQTSEETVVGLHAFGRLPKGLLEPCVLNPPEES